MRGVSLLAAGVIVAITSACFGEPDAPSTRSDDTPGDASVRNDASARNDASTSTDASTEVTPEQLAAALHAYIDDPTVGRRALEASLVNRRNGYAQLRLERYTAEGWGALPELNAPTLPMQVSALTPPSKDAPTWRALDLTLDGSMTALIELGRRAFFAYPVQVARSLPVAVASADRAGVWEQDGQLATVWVQLPGSVLPSYTCATCHVVKDERGALVIGRNNDRLDAARIAGDGTNGPAWGLGRVDVTGDDSDNPVSITDLRPTRWQKRMHHAATLELRDDADGVVALAVRIETLILTSHGQSARPPRAIAAGLAAFLRSLADPTPRSQLTLDAGARAGSVHFEQHCARCHAGEGASGPGVPLAEVGTDPAVGLSSERGTGLYRVPSLRHVGDRRRLFASGDVDDLEMLLDPARTVAGHPFGLTLSADARAELLAYLRSL